MNSAARVRTGRPGLAFMWSKRHRDVDDPNERMVICNQGEKKVTQEEQDAEDKKMREEVMRNLINTWQERLQLLSVITTFFATTEAAMLVNTRPASTDDFANNVLRVSNASLLGSLILHVYVSILSFLGAFLLISYKLKEATREELIIEGVTIVNSRHERFVIDNVERVAIDSDLSRTLASNDAQSMTQINHGTATSTRDQNNRDSLNPGEPLVFSTNPHLEQVGPVESHASSHRILSRIHSVCVFLAAIGFVLAIVGILCYSWALQPSPVSIFTTTCLGGALLTSVALFV